MKNIYEEISNNEIFFNLKIDKYLKNKDKYELYKLLFVNTTHTSKLLELDDINVEILLTIIFGGYPLNELRDKIKNISINNINKFLPLINNIKNDYILLDFILKCKNVTDNIVNILFESYKNKPWHIQYFINYENLSSDKIIHIYKKIKYKKYKHSFNVNKIEKGIINHKNTPIKIKEKFKLTNLLT